MRTYVCVCVHISVHTLITARSGWARLYPWTSNSHYGKVISNTYVRTCIYIAYRSLIGQTVSGAPSGEKIGGVACAALCNWRVCFGDGRQYKQRTGSRECKNFALVLMSWENVGVLAWEPPCRWKLWELFVDFTDRYIGASGSRVCLCTCIKCVNNWKIIMYVCTTLLESIQDL